MKKKCKMSDHLGKTETCRRDFVGKKKVHSKIKLHAVIGLDKNNHSSTFQEKMPFT